MNDYEAKEFEKLRVLIRAAKQNGCAGDEIEMRTSGHDPHCSFRIKAYVLEKFLLSPGYSRGFMTPEEIAADKTLIGSEH